MSNFLFQFQQSHAPGGRGGAAGGVLLLDGRRVLVAGVGVARARLARPQEEQVQNGPQKQACTNRNVNDV